jgi:hypothetical protein
LFGFQGLQNLSVNCFLDAAVGALRDRCDGLTSCQVAADTFRLAPADPCPAHARYLEAHYVCNSRTGSIERGIKMLIGQFNLDKLF